jgi:signal transduction histidine kinase
MNKHYRKLARQYTRVLKSYLQQAQEVILHQAYEIGRQAIARDLGVLDIAKMHQAALRTLRLSVCPTHPRDCAFATAETFFMEALVPCEATHRGFREANLKLRQLNEALEHRSTELAARNSDLASEILERRKTEAALRQSEEHYRILFNQARLMEEDLRHLSSKILHVQEEERKRISRELHDQVGQALTAINMNLAVLRQGVASDRPPTRTLIHRIADTEQLLQQTMETVHRFSRELRPAMLDDLGLIPALRSCLKIFSERTGLRVRLHAEVGVEALDDEAKTVLYRVAQESMTNTAKHAQATEVTVTVQKLKGAIRMEIKDNGQGFQMNQEFTAKRKKRLGLFGMQERARLVHGDFSFSSLPGRGTTVRVLIPFTEGASQDPSSSARVAAKAA